MIAKARKLQLPKIFTGELPTLRFVDPDFVYIATNNARCKTADLCIKEGDYLKIGQVIGMRHGGFFEQPIHSTVSGTFVGLEKHYHRNGKMVDFIKIQNDKKDVFDESLFTRSDEEIFKMTKDEITKVVKDTALVGLGGSSFPTYIKFQTDLPIHTILINGIECEPLLTSDYRIMMEYPDRIMKGISYAMHAFNAKKAIICFKKKHKDLKLLYKEIIRRYPDIDVSIGLMDDFYPQGWEIAMIKKALHIDVKSGELPSKYGVMNFNVSTIVGLYKALKYNMPVVKRNITITGNGIKYPQNLRVRVGTSIRELINLCGGYVDDGPFVFIVGGPMMGASLDCDDVIITKTVTSIIVLKKIDFQENPCIRCGSCGYSCPTKLMPWAIMNAVKSLNKERLKALHPERCIECGLCAYACTSKINVTDYIRRAKLLAK